MKYVTRPAPAPPGTHQQTNSISATQMVKPKPPRPPPPRAVPSNPQTESKSSKIFSNLFGKKPKSTSTTTSSSASASHMEVRLPPPRLPFPAAALANRHATIPQAPAPVHKSDVQLINFEESPPSSPSPVGFIKKSNTGGSDSVSIDSFCSTNSSPHIFNSGTQSQAESGFEDDFNSVSDYKLSSRAVSRSTTFSSDPFEILDDFSTAASGMSAPPPTVKNTVNIRNLKPTIQPKPVSIGNTNVYSASGTPSPNFVDDSLKNVKPSVVSMPTIIKPVSSTSSLGSYRKPSPSIINELKKPTIGPMSNYKELDATSDESFEDEPPSPPMPSFPAPVLVLDNEIVNESDEEKESHAIAIYDFESDVNEDLSFKANEKIYLVKQMNDEWMFGRNRRGCEGIFPVSYVDIRVPLKNYPETDSGTASRSESVSPAAGNRVRVLYTFSAEAEGDLTILENDFVNVMYKINDEWLYGSNTNGEYGQFPATFLEVVPQNLLAMPKY